MWHMCWCRSRSRPRGRIIRMSATSRSSLPAHKRRARISRPPFCTPHPKLSGHDHAFDLRNVPVLFTADIILDLNLRVQIVDEACTPWPGEYFRIIDGDDILKRGVVQFAYALDRRHRVGMRCAGRIEKRLVIKTGALDHQRIAL